MLLAYDKNSGKVLWNSGTNSAYPDGPPEQVAYNAVGRDNVGLIRLNDVRDAALVAKAFTHVLSVSAGKVYVGSPLSAGGDDDGPPEPVSPATAEQLMAFINKLQEQQDALTAQQVALQQQSDDLMLMMFGGGAL